MCVGNKRTAEITLVRSKEISIREKETAIVAFNLRHSLAINELVTHILGFRKNVNTNRRGRFVIR